MIPELCLFDTNVGITANGQASHATIECQIACIEAIQAIVASGRIVLDDSNLIFTEYRRNLSLAGQPSIGDQFMKWVHDNSYNVERCLRVTITPKGADPGDFEEFPDDPELAKFDRSDRKFVAVAAACNEKATILNATDSDWRDHETALRRAGIELMFLCGIRPRSSR